MDNLKEDKLKLVRTIRAFCCQLGEKYGAKRIYLFGSLIKDTFLKGSDIDLAVEGIDFENYLKLLAEQNTVNGIHLDILHLGICKSNIKKQILNDKKVKIVYEKR